MTAPRRAASWRPTPPSMSLPSGSIASPPSLRNLSRPAVFSACCAGKRARPAVSIIQGDVGRGKTLLLDMFFEHAPVRKKRRVHFHAFMQEVHTAIFAIRQNGQDRNGDAVVTAARDIAAAARLLCFDEFQVNDIADAMILGRLFEALFAAGTVIVLTANIPPADLYRHGLNRQVFLPFIRLIEERLELVTLSGGIDHRLQRVGGEQVYFCPLGAGADARLQWLWKRLTDTDRGEPVTLAVKGRNFLVPQAARKIARFDFADLCQAAVGPADYLAIAAVFDGVFVEQIPVLQPAQVNEACRFTMLIDTLYDRQIRFAALPRSAGRDLRRRPQHLRVCPHRLPAPGNVSASYWRRARLTPAAILTS